MDPFGSSMNCAGGRSSLARVLVVDDDVNARLVTRLVLENGGHAVDEASSGHEALAHLRTPGSPRPAAICADMRLPMMSGLELINELRTGDLSLIPVVLLTGDTEARSRAPQDVRVLLKPFEPRELLAAIEEFTGG
jgi:CheY-like chemotaxis protein